MNPDVYDPAVALQTENLKSDIQIDVSRLRIATDAYFPHENGAEFVYRPGRGWDSKKNELLKTRPFVCQKKRPQSEFGVRSQSLWLIVSKLFMHHKTLFHHESEIKMRKFVFHWSRNPSCEKF